MRKARMHEAKEGQNPSNASKVRSGLSPSALQPYKGSRTHDYWSLRENGLVFFGGGGVGVVLKREALGNGLVDLVIVIDACKWSYKTDKIYKWGEGEATMLGRCDGSKCNFRYSYD